MNKKVDETIATVMINDKKSTIFGFGKNTCNDFW